MPLQAVAVDAPATDDGTALFVQRSRDSAADADVARRALDTEARRQAAAGDDDMAQYLQEALGQVKTSADMPVPPEVAATSTPLETWLAYEPYTELPTLASEPLPSPRPQPRPPAWFQPRSIADLHQVGFLADFNDWLRRSKDWMLAVARGDAQLPQRPEVFVRDNAEAFVPAAQGVVWDTRRAAEGIIVPADFTCRMPSKWDVEWLRHAWRHYEDRDTVGHACDGADFKLPDLPLQYCLSPHLFSITEGYGDILSDLVQLRDLDYYSFFAQQPFCPCRLTGQGSRPKDEKLRRIASGSSPYTPTPGGTGVVALSINAASRTPWPAEAEARPRTRWRVAGTMVLVALLFLGAVQQIPNLHRRRRRFRKERKPKVEHAMSDTRSSCALSARWCSSLSTTSPTTFATSSTRCGSRCTASGTPAS
jgi:hypothetical protein